MTLSKSGLTTTLLFLAALLLPAPLPAQITFERTYSDTSFAEGWAVQQTSDGGYIIAGLDIVSVPQSYDIYFMRTDSAGETLWTGLYGGGGIDEGRSALQTSDGGFLIAGTMDVQGTSYDAFLVKTDSNGHTLWTKAYGGTGTEGGNSVQQTCDGGYIIAGYTAPYGEEADVLLIKTDSNGDTLWTRTFGGPDIDLGLSVQQTADSGYIVAGWTTSYSANQIDFYLIRTNAAGYAAWTRTYGGTHTDKCMSVQQTADGGFIAAGYTASFGAGDWDVYLIKTDADGDTVWTRTFGNSEADYGYSVQQTSDGGYVVTGQTYDFGTHEGRAYLIKTDSFGDSLWTRSFCPNGYRNAEGHSVLQTADGGYAVLGYAYGFPGLGSDVYLIKTDSLGQVYVGIEEHETPPTRAPSLSLSCSPNPASGSVTVSLSPSIPLSPSSVLHLFDASGRLVLSQPVRTSPFILHPSSLPAGVYVVRLDCGAVHASTRLVVQK